MPDYKPLEQIAGNVGRSPEVKPGYEGNDFTSFSVAVNRSYGEEGNTQWYSVAINKPALQAWVQDNIRKGSAVVVEGSTKETTRDGTTFHNMTGFRVGLVDWFRPGATAPREEEEDF